MGLLSKLFGLTKKRKYFFVSSTLMEEQLFWEIIYKSHRMARGEYEKQQIALYKLLIKLHPQQIIEFENRFCQLRDNINTWRLWGAIYIINGGCSNDNFYYYKSWLIAQGKIVYDMVLNDPNTIETLHKNIIGEEWEGIEYVATQVFEKITGEEIPSEYIEQPEPRGVEWDENGNDLEKMFPTLWVKYCDGHNDLQLS